MITRCRWAAAVAAFVSFAVFGSASIAEVSVEVDAAGRYWRTVVRTNQSAKNLRIWGVGKYTGARLVLNPDGDAFGDLWPTIVENTLDGGRPHVTWSRFDGTSYDLVWSHWTDDAGWADLEWLVATPTPGDDLDPDLVFDPGDGRPRVVWWTASEGRGEVFLALFLSTRWMSPYRVSAVDEDARYPTVDVLDDGTIRVSFETPDGTQVRYVKFHRPDTITDDLNPLEYLTLSADQPGSINEQKSGPP